MLAQSLVLATLLLASAGDPLAAASELTYHLEPGKTHTLRITTSSRSRMESVEVEIEAVQTLTYRAEVLSRDDEGNQTLRLTLTHVRMEGPMADYDSSREKNHTFEAQPLVLGALVGKAFDITLSSTGDLVAGDTLGAAITEAADAILAEMPHMFQAIREIRGSMTPQGFLGEIGRCLPNLPGEMKATWTGKNLLMVPLYGPYEETRTLTLAGIPSGDDLSFSVTGKGSYQKKGGLPFFKLLESSSSFRAEMRGGDLPASSRHEASLRLEMAFPGSEAEKTSIDMTTELVVD
jgi:hypothetical protein